MVIDLQVETLRRPSTRSETDRCTGDAEERAFDEQLADERAARRAKGGPHRRSSSHDRGQLARETREVQYHASSRTSPTTAMSSQAAALSSGSTLGTIWTSESVRARLSSGIDPSGRACQTVRDEAAACSACARVTPGASRAFAEKLCHSRRSTSWMPISCPTIHYRDVKGWSHAGVPPR